MHRFIIRFAVGLVTFTVGITIFSILSLPRPLESNNLVGPVELGEPRPKEAPTLPQDLAVKGSSNLSIVIEGYGANPDEPSSTLRHIKLKKNRPSIIQLDLGEDIDNQEIRLNFRDHSVVEYRMLQRYRTSMSISAEGPHFDLVDWRHFDSPWIPLASLGAKRFRTLKSEQMEHSRFPTTTKSEILKEVRLLAAKDWPELLELVEDCRGPNDGACLVSISSIYLRIQKQVRGRWIDVGLAEFRVPMGC